MASGISDKAAETRDSTSCRQLAAYVNGLSLMGTRCRSKTLTPRINLKAPNYGFVNAFVIDYNINRLEKVQTWKEAGHPYHINLIHNHQMGVDSPNYL